MTTPAASTARRGFGRHGFGRHGFGRGWVGVGWAIGRRPRLWRTGLRQARRLARRGWWRHRPFLPVPGGEYLAFRTETQYGDAEHRPQPTDVVNYLSWCREMDRR